jgi:hypothetical protein
MAREPPLLGTARESGLKRLLVHRNYKLPLYGREPAHVFSVHSCRFILYGQGPVPGSLGTARESGLKRLLVHHSYKLPLYGREPAHVF